MSLNGQWIARYSGSNTGLLVAELDDVGDHYEGTAFLADDMPGNPNSVASIRTTSKADAGHIENAPVRPFDKLGNLIPTSAIEQLKMKGLSFPDSVAIDFNLREGQLSVEWKTSIGTFGGRKATAPKTRGGEPSEIVPLPIRTWDDFKHYVTSLEPQRYIFRGQENNSWRLRSRFYRTGRASLERYLIEDVSQLNKYLSAVTAHWFDLNKPLQYGAFINLAQHHGYPTPLLDWTWSPYVAAFFAFRRIKVNSEMGVLPSIRIYKFDIREWNRLPAFAMLFPILPHVSVLDALAYDNSRVIPQQAISIISNVDDIETHVKTVETNSGISYLEVIDIPAENRKSIMTELALMGITAGALFPGIDGACEALRVRNFG
jgi:hypothetical protein